MTRHPIVPRGQGGYALVTVIGVSAVLMLLVMAGFATVDGAVGGSARDARSKDARAAADAGVALYAARLAADPDYWKRCTNTGSDPVHSGTAGARRWQRVDGASPAAPGAPEYTIELVPAGGNASCVADTPTTVFDPATNALRVRVTGRAGGVRRTVLASFRRGSLLKYLYYTTYETTDTALYPDSAPSGRDRAWAQSATGGNCANPYGVRSLDCQDIQFAANDVVAGPLHTEDTAIRVCGTPQLGRPDTDDVVEARGDPGWYARGCTGSNPGVRPNASTVAMPGDIDSTLKSTAAAGGSLYSGRTEFTFTGSTFTAKLADGTTSAPRTLPSNGVIYVQPGSAGCSAVQNPRTVFYDEEQPCQALAYVKGSVDRDLTIASAGDVVVNGSLLAGPDRPLLGLVANNFVRVYHPVDISVTKAGTYVTDTSVRESPGTTYKPGSVRCRVDGRDRWCTDYYRTTCENAPGSMTSGVRIDAAILARTHSFVVDNWGTASNFEDTDLGTNCPGLGTLTVTGAIIQQFRGPVATTGGTGYLKNYVYDDRLKVRNPPFFPQPQGSIWRTVRTTEQLPAANPGP